MDNLKSFPNYSGKCLYYDSFFYKLLLSRIGNFWSARPVTLSHAKQQKIAEKNRTLEMNREEAMRKIQQVIGKAAFFKFFFLFQLLFLFFT